MTALFYYFAPIISIPNKHLCSLIIKPLYISNLDKCFVSLNMPW